jgi:Mrp family chromosome partitioning ATPase
MEKIENGPPGIKKRFAIASGKGGVGKSTVTALLASYLAARGKKVAILDADVTGPSIPRMLGIAGRPTVENSKMIPPSTSNGIKAISMNMFLENEGEPVIWRGPRVSNAITQFFSETEWGELDFLLVDLPPGTSDVPLTVMQSLKLDGIVIVTSPQSLVAMVVEKAVGMAGQMKAPILGRVENMSGMKCPRCGEVIDPFGKSDHARLPGLESVPLLGRLSLDPELSRACDEGKLADYRSAEAEALVEEFLRRL